MACAQRSILKTTLRGTFVPSESIVETLIRQPPCARHESPRAPPAVSALSGIRVRGVRRSCSAPLSVSPDQGSPQGASQPAHRRAKRREIHSWLDVNLATLFALDHTSVLQIDQIFLLQRAELVQHLIGGVNAIEVEDHQIAHGHPPLS